MGGREQRICLAEEDKKKGCVLHPWPEMCKGKQTRLVKRDKTTPILMTT